MRLIGNKTRLLGDIEAFLRDRGIQRGVLLDVFSGTASVGKHFKKLGFRVIANDHMASCYAKAVAEIEVSRYPAFEKLREKYSRSFASPDFHQSLLMQGSLLDLEAPRAGRKKIVRKGAGGESRGRHSSRPPAVCSSDPGPLRDAVHLINELVEPCDGIIFRNYCPGGPRGGRYFTDQNGRKVDGVLRFLRENHREGILSRAELYLLLSALLDAVDRVANISGTYGAYLKKWQANTAQRLRLLVPEVVESPLAHEAHREDANQIVRRIPADVLYIDPPYNKRQYPANYHILEVIAEHHSVEDLDAYEASLYGKTGLRPYGNQKSLYCIKPSARSNGGNVLGAMTDLILSCRAKHVLVSYNEEGLLSRDEIGAILARFSGARAFDFREDMRTVSYQRFRSDSDRRPGHAKGQRQYRVLEGRSRNEIAEWLLYAARPRRKARSPAIETTP